MSCTRVAGCQRHSDDDDVFEATTRLDPDEQAMVRTLIEAVLLKHEAKRWAS